MKNIYFLYILLIWFRKRDTVCTIHLLANPTSSTPSNMKNSFSQPKTSKDTLWRKFTGELMWVSTHVQKPNCNNRKCRTGNRAEPTKQESCLKQTRMTKKTWRLGTWKGWKNCRNTTQSSCENCKSSLGKKSTKGRNARLCCAKWIRNYDGNLGYGKNECLLNWKDVFSHDVLFIISFCFSSPNLNFTTYESIFSHYWNCFTNDSHYFSGFFSTLHSMRALFRLPQPTAWSFFRMSLSYSFPATHHF